MSLLDPVEVQYDEKYEVYWLLRGRETYYDAERYRRGWDSESEAIQWAQENIPNAEIYSHNGEISSVTVKKDGNQLGWNLAERRG